MRLDIRAAVRYARTRVYAIAVRIHAAVYFPNRGPVSVLAPLCEPAVSDSPNAVLCHCTHYCGQCPPPVPDYHLYTCQGLGPARAPFTGTPYDPDSEED